MLRPTLPLILALFLAPAGASAAGFVAKPSLATQQDPATLVLDASRAADGIMEVRERIPATAGSFTIVYPKWIPGEHGPTGPLNDLAALRVSADGAPLDWRRDPNDLYTFHVDVPAGTQAIDAEFDVLMNAPGDVMSTHSLAIVNWNRALLYQDGIDSHRYFVKPSIVLPPGWDFATALRGATQSGNRVDFAVTPLNMLVDSPLDLGRFVRKWNLWQEGSAFVQLDAFADRPQDLDIPASLLHAYQRVPDEAFALYGSRHFADYHALLTLSDAVGFEGIEHHQSSDDRAPDDFLTDPDESLSGRRSHNARVFALLERQVPPACGSDDAELSSASAHRSALGLRGHESIFGRPAFVSRRHSRAQAVSRVSCDRLLPKWIPRPAARRRPSSISPRARPITYVARGDYGAIRRNAGDFYTEGELVWLDVDTIIRERSHGARSLDTFLHRYTEPALTGPIVKTYTRAEIETLLNQVEPYDWHAFFDKYVYHTSVHPPADELARAGWRFVYTEKPNVFITASQADDHGITGWYSYGADLSAKGVVRDVREGSPAWRAGLAPGMHILAVDNQEFSAAVFEYAVKKAQHSSAPISLITSQTGWFQTLSLDYHDGIRYPHLERIEGTPDMLAAIMAPHAK